MRCVMNVLYNKCEKTSVILNTRSQLFLHIQYSFFARARYSVDPVYCRLENGCD